MSITDLGSLGEFVSSIAVLFTLIYLVLQIRQNTRSIRSQSRFHVLEALNSDTRSLTENDRWELSTRVAIGEANSADLAQWGYVYASWLSHLEMLYFELLENNLPKDFEHTLRYRLYSLFKVPNGEENWKTHKGLCTKKFQSYVENLQNEESIESQQ